MPAGVFLDVVDPWVNWDWLSTHIPLILAALQEHATLTVIAVVVGLVLSLPIGIAAHRWGWLRNPVLAAFGILYTIPSLALFSLLIPYTGLTFLTAEIGLVSYTLLIELPLALPVIIAGIRVATVTTIGLVTITALIGLGGLGQLILKGLIENFHTPLVVATVLSIVLALVADLALAGVQRLAVPWSRGT
jgi:osmoprotectant transport system permease protein